MIPNPQLAVDLRSGRVYVAYSAGNAKGVLDTDLAVFDASLEPVDGFPRRAHAPDGGMPSDQFMPAVAVDAKSGALWVCFYDTRPDRSRRRAWFSCTASRDGGETFARPVRAATLPSDETRPPAEVSFAYGEYTGLVVADGVAHPFWTDSREVRSRHEEIYTTTLEIRRG